MLPEQGIKRELSLGDVIQKTFELYRKDFAKYFLLFAVVGVIIGVVTAVARSIFVIPTLARNATPDQFFVWLPMFIAAFTLQLGTIFLVSIIVSPIAQGSAIKLASEQIESRPLALGESVRFAASKLLSMWALSIVTGILVILGIIALIVPGIILAIMFSLALPALLLENKGVFDSMGRSRQLVSHRWLKTFAIFLIVGIIVVIGSGITNAISSLFGVASPVVSGFLGALLQPLVPILLAVYYYSNLARLVPVTLGPSTSLPPTVP